MEDSKIYTTDGGSNFANGALMGASLNKGSNDMMAAAMMNGGMGAQWNNPMWLIWAMLFGGNGWFGNRQGDNGLTTQIQNLQGVVQDNHNSDLLMQAVGGNTAAITQLANTLNVSSDQLAAGISNVRDAITAANGNIQLAAQQMISNNNLQSAALGTQIGATGNGIQREILSQGYQSQLATQAANYQNQIGNLQQSNLLQLLNQQQNQLISNGFTQIGFQIERQGCEIKEASLANTQKLLDTLNGHWNSQYQTENAQLKAQISQLQQTQQLLSAINSSSSATRSAAA